MSHDESPVGVLAPTQSRAKYLIQELGLTDSVVISPRGLRGTRGRFLRALIVEDSLWPLDQQIEDALLPCFALRGGYILRLSRVVSLTEEKLEMTQELNAPILTETALPERSLRYLSSVVGKLPPMDTAPAAWFFSMDKEVLEGYENYRVAKKAWDDRMAELLELTGCTKYYAGPGHLMGLQPPNSLTDPPRWWRATKKGYWVPRARTKAEKTSEASKRFKAAHDIPWPVNYLPGIPKDLWTHDAVYPVHIRKPGQAVLAFLGGDPDKGDPVFEVGNEWSRLKLSMYHALKEYQSVWLPKN